MHSTLLFYPNNFTQTTFLYPANPSSWQCTLLYLTLSNARWFYQLGGRCWALIGYFCFSSSVSLTSKTMTWQLLLPSSNFDRCSIFIIFDWASLFFTFVQNVWAAFVTSSLPSWYDNIFTWTFLKLLCAGRKNSKRLATHKCSLWERVSFEWIAFITKHWKLRVIYDC